ncbi:hypothetical protein B0H13DRAFT_2410405, partial [Mycena leptocephala]
NATNNDMLVESFANRCLEKGIPFSARHGRMWCMPHTIHLAALKLLEAIGALTKDERKKAESRAGAYQEATTESLSRTQDNHASQGDDDEDEDTTQPMSLIGIAVFKVSFTLVHFKSKQSQLRKIVRHVWSSPQRRRTWEGFGGRLILILDVKT